MKKISFIFTLSLCLVGMASLSLAEDGKQVYDQFCVSCHGASGAGDGPVGAALPADQKPRNFVEWKMKHATDDAKLKEVIKQGGAPFGMSPLMAALPLSDAQVDAVITYIKAMKK